MMHSDDNKKLDAAPVDDATRAAIEEGLAAAEGGEIVSQEQARILVRERHKAWRKTQQEALRA